MKNHNVNITTTKKNQYSKADTYHNNMEYLTELKDCTDEKRKACLTEKLIYVNRKSVCYFARRLLKLANGTITDIDDLISIGNMGIVYTIERFDMDKKYQFSSYLFSNIHFLMLKAISANRTTIKLPAEKMTKLNKMSTIMVRNPYLLSNELDQLLIEQMRISENELMELRGYYHTHFKGLISLDAEYEKIQEEECIERALGFLDIDLSHSTETTVVSKIMYEDVERIAKENLTESEWKLLERYFGLNGYEATPTAQIAREEGCSKSCGSYRKNNAIRKLKKALRQKGYFRN
ncbi:MULTISPECIES: sigma-70 family RNA polymerase sigma factor [Staphylococcus]|uniref:sigma-70 family RNA polymerase sigma factor n=1 Tax=Staphylococcus TaxID=1279 RepID=UPI0021CE7695|nr:sigma-70 family RNA polymerase sigma factor [Staphylococcus sp. IVB6181]UXV35190.1 sigma-70 family RNA polymerase sigma factor [Staphylococcus sp. IVB6181]